MRSAELRRAARSLRSPPANRVPEDIERFLNWFENPGDIDPLLVAGLAHLWFVTIHPFDDGNGRIARAIADMALARGERVGQRFYSMSGQIRAERKTHYTMLERTQKAELDIMGEDRQVLAGYRLPRHHGPGRTRRAQERPRRRPEHQLLAGVSKRKVAKAETGDKRLPFLKAGLSH